MVATVSPVRTGFTPSVPQTFEDLGISQSLVLDLVLRRLLLEGFSTLEQLSDRLKVAMPILNIVFQHMRSQQLVEVKGMVGNDYHFTLSQAGKMLSSERFQITQYAGAAPVSLKDYHSATKIASGASSHRSKGVAVGFLGSGGDGPVARSIGSSAHLTEFHLHLWTHRKR